MKILPIILGVLAIATTVPAWLPEHPPALGTADLHGKLLTSDGAEKAPDQVADLRVATWDDSTLSPKVFEVKKDGGIWIIPSAYGYPADGDSRVGRTAGGVLNVPRGRFVTSDPKQYEDLGVNDPLDEKQDGKKGRGKRVTVRDATGSPMVDLIIGNTAPDGDDVAFVRQADDAAVYTAKVNADISTRFVDWVETDLLKLKPEDIRFLRVADYSVDADRNAFIQRSQTEFTRPSADGAWRSPETPAGKQPNAGVVGKLLSESTGLRLVGVRPFRLDWLPRRGFFPVNDPQYLSQPGALVLSLDGHPYALFGNEGRLDIGTRDGLRYSLVFGAVAVDDEQDTQATPKAGAASGHNRYMAVFVHYDPSADETAHAAAPKPGASAPVASGQQRAEKAQQRFSHFFYVISDDSFKAMRPDQASLFQAKPAPPAPAVPAVKTPTAAAPTPAPQPGATAAVPPSPAGK